MTAPTVLCRVNETHRLGLSFAGRCPGGEVGAYYARANDGGRFVFKWSEDADDLGYFAAVTERVSRVRAVGYPAPRYLAPMAVDGAVVVFQEWVGGEWRDQVDAALVATVLRLNDLQSGQGGSDGGWTDYIRLTLTEGADGYCRHETLRGGNDASRRIVEWVEGVGQRLGRLPDADLVHLDFHHRNMLRDGEELAAVIDWEGCGAGDRAFDLVTFCFGMSHAVAAPDVFEPIWRRALEVSSPQALTAYVAHMALRRLDWTIRHHPHDVERVISIAHNYIQRVS